MKRFASVLSQIGLGVFALVLFGVGTQGVANADGITPTPLVGVTRAEFSTVTDPGDAPCVRRVRLQYQREGAGALVSQWYFLIEPCVAGTDHDEYPEPVLADAKAILILFSGGSGKNFIQNGEPRSTNYVVRERYAYAATGPFIVAVIDAASDFLANGGVGCPGPGLRGCRFTDNYMIDVANVIQDLRETARFPANLPVWLVGTSRGTNSAVAAADLLDPTYGPDGLVLTASLIEDPDPNEDAFDADLSSITVPVQIITHGEDECTRSSPFRNAPDYDAFINAFTASSKVKVEHLFRGGYPAIGQDCGPLSPHGFFGLEPKVAKKIVKFILKHSD